MAKITCLLITGMHRSGTSLVAESVASLGLSVGDTLLPANEFNARGYFEDAAVVQLHDRLLDKLGRPWGSIEHVRPMPAGWQNRRIAKSAIATIRDYLNRRAETADGQAFAVKDPRLCLFLPLWKKAAAQAGVDLKTLAVFRSPSAVAASLARRDGTSAGMAHLLWLQYSASLLAQVDPKTCGLVFDEDWARDPKEQVKRIAAFLGLRKRKLPEPLFDPDLRNTDASGSTGLLQVWAKALRAAHSAEGPLPRDLIRLARGYLQHAQILDAVAESLSTETKTDRESRLVKDLATYRAAHDDAVAEAATQARRANADIENMRVRMESLGKTYSSALRRMGDENSKLQATIAEEKVHTEEEAQRALEFHTAYQTIDARLKDALADLEAVRDKSRKVETKLNRAQTNAKRDKSALKSANAQIKEMTATLAHLRKERDQLYTQAVDNLAAYQTIDACNTAAEAEIARLRDLQANRQHSYDVAAHALTLARTNMRDLAAQRDKAEAERLVLSNTLHDREARIADIQQQLDQAHSEMTDLRNALSSALAELEGLRKWHLPSRLPGVRTKR